MYKTIAVPVVLENKNENEHLLIISYQGGKGDYLIKAVKKNLLPNNYDYHFEQKVKLYLSINMTKFITGNIQPRIL